MRSRVRVTLTTAASVLAIAACGGSGKSRGPSEADAGSGLKFAACMRAHGVPNFPDPSGGGGIQIPSDINPASPAFQTAQHACQSLMPGGAGGPPQANEQQKEALLRMSRCMRSHGVTGFPDPVSSPPRNPAGFALAFGRPGSFIVVPDTLNPRSPTFRQAAQTCHLPGA